MLLYTHAVWGLVLAQFFGPSSWLSPALVRAVQQDSYNFSFWWLVADGWMWPVYGLSMAVLLLFTLGLYTRVTSILALLVVISFAHRVPQATFGLDQINAMLTLYLAIGPSGQALSLDRVIARRRRGRPLAARAKCRGQSGIAVDQRPHVRHLFLRGHLKVAGRVVVDGRGDVAGVLEPGVPVDRHDLAGLAPLAAEPGHPRVCSLGNLLLRPHLAAPPATLDAGHGRRAPRGNRRVPRDVDVRLDHACWLRLVSA